MMIVAEDMGRKMSDLDVDGEKLDYLGSETDQDYADMGEEDEDSEGSWEDGEES